MRLAYLMNAYPMTSTTFIRREIQAHERAGVSVDRFAIRPWDQNLVDPDDIQEKTRVFYLLGQGLAPLFWLFFKELFVNPVGIGRGLKATLHMIRNDKGRRLKTIIYFLEAIRLKREAEKRGITHIHTHFSSNSAAVAMVSHLVGGPAFSMTIHGPDELYEMTENSLGLKVDKAAFTAVITEYCRSVVDDHTQGRFTDKIKIVPCGLELSEFLDTTVVPDNKTLVCVGRLCDAKAQPILVEAIAKVVKNHPTMKLILIGDGDLRKPVEQAIDTHELHQQVELAGWKSNAEVREILLKSRALVLPSLAEGLPIVIMESFALGRPVLSTRINGIPELVDANCGWLAEAGDQDTLVDSLNALLSADTKTLTRMGEIGRERVKDRHDQDRNAESLRNLILSAGHQP